MTIEQSTYPSWPELYRPPIDDTVPELHLKTSAGLTAIKSDDDFTMYICGITPYDATHLGHAATYIAFDLINRYQSARKAQVNFVENITDIDEPLLERAERDQIDWRSLAENQVDLFRSDMTALRILPPSNFVPATAVMDLVDTAITQLDRNGFVYRIDQDLYFDISTFLGSLPISEKEALEIFSQRGGDPARPGKHHKLDPVLWWAHKNNEPGWQSSHGYGRPGWHIECVVIALRYLLGSSYLTSNSRKYSINLQGGGSDLIFPHHFMSSAQATALLGQPFAAHFVHTGMVGLDGEKMSKSKGNLVFVSKLLSQGIEPLSIRYALMRDSYQSDRMWGDQLLESATTSVEIVRMALSREFVLPTQSVRSAIIEAMSQNLETPTALAALESWAKSTLVADSEATQQGAGDLSRLLDSLLGLSF